MNNDLSELSKIQLRPRLLEALRSPRADEVRDQLKLFNEKLRARLAQESGRWAAFKAFDFEPDPQVALINSSHIEWVYPRVAQHELHFYRVGDAHGWRLNKWGIAEPDPQHAERVRDDSIVGLLVPGLAFDAKCNRMGRGRGFYDRFLGNVKHSPRLLGLAFDRQLVDFELPVDAHDVPMHEVLTESRHFLGATRASSGTGSERKTS